MGGIGRWSVVSSAAGAGAGAGAEDRDTLLMAAAAARVFLSAAVTLVTPAIAKLLTNRPRAAAACRGGRPLASGDW